MMSDIGMYRDGSRQSYEEAHVVRSLVYDKLYIGGRWATPSTGQRFSVISPHSEEPIGETPEAAPEDVDKAVAAARTAFDEGPWPRMSPSERMEKVEKLAAVYSGHTEEMADLITAEMGSPTQLQQAGAGHRRRRADAPRT